MKKIEMIICVILLTFVFYDMSIQDITNVTLLNAIIWIWLWLSIKIDQLK